MMLRTGLLLMGLLPWHTGMAQETDSISFLQSVEYNQQLDRAIEYQQKADSLYHLSVAWRLKANRMDDPLERGRLQGQIEAVEDSMAACSSLAEHYFGLLDRPRSSFIILDTVLHGIRVYHYKQTDELMARLDSMDEKPDTLQPVLQTDKNPEVNFKIYKASPYGPGHSFEHEFIPPKGTFYRIQMAVYSKEIQTDHFGGLYPVMSQKIPGKTLTRYFVGKFRKLAEAKIALQKVRRYGYTDAFIIGYYDGVIGTLEKLQVLENE